jgi:hypothetical protein
MASYWSGSNRCVGPQLELIRQERLHATVIHYHHHQINGLPANLQTHASASRG